MILNQAAAIKLIVRNMYIAGLLPVFLTIKPPARDDRTATDVPNIPDIKPICFTL
jgi:hypothetical protein